MSSFLTPGVYTEEVSTLPPSVADVSTAVPAFIGYTEQAVKGGKEVSNQAVRISTLLEFNEIFGGAQPASLAVNVGESAVESVAVQPPTHTLYHALDLYFKNGGSDCYIISVGSCEEATHDKEAYLKGLDVLAKEDEPTLIILGEATKLSSSDYFEVCTVALAQCATLKDRFCILDVPENGVESFRNGIGMNNLKYGAAYTPYLQTSISYTYDDSGVEVSGSSIKGSAQIEIDGIRVSYTGPDASPKVKINKGSDDTIDFSIEDNVLTITNVGVGVEASAIISAWNSFAPKEGFSIDLVGSGDATVTSTTSKNLTGANSDTLTLADLKVSQSALYSQVVTEIAKEKITLPPSAAIAGVYATTDRERGVWKAPANVGVNAVISPTEKITSAEQEKLNVDSGAGKSINAIRSFTGKGIMVWGARTLAGNDNEWRYIPVRRLFNTIEEATKKASEFAVFEPNSAVTWLKVKAMIDSYLYGIWQQGALAGSIAEQAYFVNIGLGKTMTQQDVLEGRMIVEIGVAAVRPAEFIVLKFSHKLQEAN